MPKLPPMDGVYNVPSDPDEPYTFYQTVAELPSQDAFYRESEEIASALRLTITEFLRTQNIPKYNEILAEVFGGDSIGEFPSDRTMCFYIGDLNAFSPELFSTLQRDVLSRFPLWRLLAQFEELAIGVYPNAAWLGDAPVTGAFTDDHPNYQEWLNAATVYREQRFGALARQLRCARQRIPDAIERMADEPYSLIGAFARFQSHLNGFPVWLIHQGHRELSFDDEYAPVRASAVSSEGEIYPEFSKLFYPKTDTKPPYWLKTHLIEDPEVTSLIVKEADGNAIGQVEWETVLDDSTLE